MAVGKKARTNMSMYTTFSERAEDMKERSVPEQQLCEDQELALQLYQRRHEEQLRLQERARREEEKAELLKQREIGIKGQGKARRVKVLT